jgi:hypothetical protein
MKNEKESDFPPKERVGIRIPPFDIPNVFILNYPLAEFLSKFARSSLKPEY